MSNELVRTIVSNEEPVRNRSINSLITGKTYKELLELASELDDFRKSSDNLYHKVRASLFLFVIYRCYLQNSRDAVQTGKIPFEGIKASYERDFEKAIHIYSEQGTPNSAVFSAIADSYYRLSFKYLLDQVKLSISHCSENHNLYNIKGLDDYPFSVSSELTVADKESGLYPVGVDASPVRLDPSHSGWSDIFFLGMDFPEGARVINLSVDLSIHGTGDPVLPPCECYCRFIEEPVIKLISVDLKASKKVDSLTELFNFGNDYLSLLKAAVVASGIIPPCFENHDIELKHILQRLLKKPGGIEIVTKVNGIPKGSRLAVSTTLLATIIARLMRFSSQIKNVTGPLNDSDRLVVASRAILGEWLGGSGGGWQDSGGLWPGIKIIKGQLAEKWHPEFGVSRGCLLPVHNIFSRDEISEETEKKILDSIVLVHGGISQDVGPVLEMVTEKYLLKYEKEWAARKTGIELFNKIVRSLQQGNMREFGRLTTQDWEYSIQEIIPWVNNAFTDDLIRKAKEEFGEDYWGFLMLGGMSGGGMAFIVEPAIKETFKYRIYEILLQLKETYSSSFPFIIDPVVYDLKINHKGIMSRLLTGSDAVMPSLNSNKSDNNISKDEITDEDFIKDKYGFDSESHEHYRSLIKTGKIGLLKNRLPLSTDIRDVEYDDINHFEDELADKAAYDLGLASLKRNEVAVVTFAGGMGSRWTSGAAVVKPVNPFVRIDGRYRSFIEIHLAKSRKTSALSDSRIQHVFTTSYLTHEAIMKYLEHFNFFNYNNSLYISPARSIGRRVYPMQKDLLFLWEEQLSQKMDENVQKVQDSIHKALITWTASKGEGDDYSENRPKIGRASCRPWPNPYTPSRNCNGYPTKVPSSPQSGSTSSTVPP